jgi:hypothetical protein
MMSALRTLSLSPTLERSPVSRTRCAGSRGALAVRPEDRHRNLGGTLSRATHLLERGTDIRIIRAWLYTTKIHAFPAVPPQALNQTIVAQNEGFRN